jgi:hypothetical protein
LPFTGALPIGLDIRTGYELAELKVQWLVCDFGRRFGRYNQADLAVDIAQLQNQRAFQTIANEVAVASFQVLRARSLHRIATESVRRAEGGTSPNAPTGSPPAVFGSTPCANSIWTNRGLGNSVPAARCKGVKFASASLALTFAPRAISNSAAGLELMTFRV